MTTYNTGNPIGSTDPRDLYDNAQNMDNLGNGTAPSYPDRLGVERKSWAGMEQDFAELLASSGYQFLGDYSSAIEVTAYNQIIREAGEFWRAAASTALPYTTTGAGMPESGAFVSVGDANLRQDLANNALGSGAALVSMEGGPSVEVAVLNRVIRVTSIAAMEAYSAPAGYVFSLNAGGRSGTFDVVSGDFSTELTADTQNAIYIGLSDNPTASTKVARRRGYETGPVNAFWFGIEGDGTNEYTKIVALEAYVFTNKRSAFFPKGVYDTGINSWPFRQQIVSGLKDYGGIVISGEGKGTTVFSTTSSEGADVLQLNGVKGISFRDLSITATLTATNDAGSNGVSITNGGQDIDIDVDVFNLPGVDKTTYLDGGKAYTLQNGATSTNDFVNITIKGNARDCPYAFEKSTPYDEFRTSVSPIYENIKIDISGRDCWIGASLGAAAATVTIADTDKNCGISVKGTFINCAQPLRLDRWVRADIDVKIIGTKPKVSLFRPFAADQSVFGAQIKGDYYSKIKIAGSMFQADSKLIIGATTQGGGVYGGCDGTEIDMELDVANLDDDAVVSVSSGGNTTKNCRFKFGKNVVATLLATSELTNPANNNTVMLGGNLKGSFSATLTGVSTTNVSTVSYSAYNNEVTLNFPELLGTSNSNFTTITGVPLVVKPASPQSFVVLVRNNEADVIGRMVLEVDGTITLYNGTAAAGGWTASGTKGLSGPSSVTYRTN